MTVYKKEEKVAVTINLKDVFNKAFKVTLLCAALIMMGFFGFLAEFYGIETIFCYVSMGLIITMGISGFVAVICEVITLL